MSALMKCEQVMVQRQSVWCRFHLPEWVEIEHEVLSEGGSSYEEEYGDDGEKRASGRWNVS